MLHSLLCCSLLACNRESPMCETKPMITLFELSDGNATLTLNQMLYGWLGAEDIQ
ncbi:MAG: hypothetical protein IJW52_00595 [Clostridia bacterium]|nr:hypothetical protein [Clostridia bacterium]